MKNVALAAFDNISILCLNWRIDTNVVATFETVRILEQFGSLRNALQEHQRNVTSLLSSRTNLFPFSNFIKYS